jgi:hypothetical protein
MVAAITASPGFVSTGMLHREGRLIHRRATLKQHAVHRYSLARAPHHGITHCDLLDRDGDLGTVTQHRCGFGRKAEQLGDRLGGAAL